MRRGAGQADEVLSRNSSTEFGLLLAVTEHRGQALTRVEMSEHGLGYTLRGVSGFSRAHRDVDL
jgi:hypothetical protein